MNLWAIIIDFSKRDQTETIENETNSSAAAIISRLEGKCWN